MATEEMKARKSRPITDELIIEALTESIMNNEFVLDALGQYTRAVLAIGPDEDVSDMTSYWEEYTRKLQYYLLQVVLLQRTELKFEQVVF